LQDFDIGFFDDGGERVAAEFPSAAESEPRFFVTGSHHSGHRSPPLEDDDLFPGLTDLGEESQTLSLEGTG